METGLIPHLHIEFFSEAVQNKAKSAEAGRPIFEDGEFVRIKFRGDKTRELVAPAWDFAGRNPETNHEISYKEMYPRHYEAFKAGQQFIGDGTPISELPFLTEAKRAELRALNIHTAEALAGLEGTPLQKLGMGARELMGQAKAWLAKAKDSAVETKLAAENAALWAQIEALKAQMAEMGRTAVHVENIEAGSVFDGYTDEDLKVFLADRAGARPRGNPSRATLIRMCEEQIATEKKLDEAA